MIQVITPDQSVGRTVKQVSFPQWDTECKIQFTDGTFLVLKIERDKYDDSVSLVSGESKDIGDYDQLRFGLIDEAELNRRRATYNQEIEQLEEERLRKQWEELNKKFGK
jgi:uncharacterized small protein (DUF1192 family)